MTLLLGPPGSGKSTLLLALAGKLDPDLKVIYQIRKQTAFLFICLYFTILELKFVTDNEISSGFFKFSGRVTYNGHDMHEFVPQRAAAYVGQHDLHIGEMTVRETLAFSARCQGVGARYGWFKYEFLFLN